MKTKNYRVSIHYVVPAPSWYPTSVVIRGVAGALNAEALRAHLLSRAESDVVALACSARAGKDMSPHIAWEEIAA